LIRDQFPQWAELRVRPVPEDGQDNRTFRLGDTMSVRVPSHPAYVEHMHLEHEWLPRIAPGLPLSIPEPVAKGGPGHGLPWGWLINKWMDGENAKPGAIEDMVAFAKDLAGFLSALRRVDATGAPGPSSVNFFRGGDLSVYDADIRKCADTLRNELDIDRVLSIWRVALDSKWTKGPVWIHGDVSSGNMLVKDGRLSAVIDFGQLAAGDPACDLTIAWTLLRGEGRAAFKGHIGLDEDTWHRARGWGLWKAMFLALDSPEEQPDASAEALRVAHEILDD
jgi:aminoglycoside phosphotransferase (APT) family kinase protein